MYETMHDRPKKGHYTPRLLNPSSQLDSTQIREIQEIDTNDYRGDRHLEDRPAEDFLSADETTRHLAAAPRLLWADVHGHRIVR